MKKLGKAVVSKPFTPIQVTLKEVNGSFEKMVRRFVRRTKDDGILNEVRERMSYKKPSELRRRKSKTVKL